MTTEGREGDMKKMEDPDSGQLKKVTDGKYEPWRELFADCQTMEDVLELRAEIDAAENA